MGSPTFLEVKHLDTLPVDVFGAGERIEKNPTGTFRLRR